MQKLGSSIAENLARKRGFYDVRILQIWNQIADGKLSQFVPIRMSAKILYVTCESKMAAIELQYVKHYIIDYFKSGFGIDISDIKIISS